MTTKATPEGSPLAPRAGASAALFRDGAVLLVERGSAPFAGLWSLPGGVIEAGETAEEAARREVREETGLEAHLSGLTGVHDVRVPGEGALPQVHFDLAVYFGRAGGGEPRPGGDARKARLVPLDALDGLALTPGLSPLVRKAARQLAEQDAGAAD